MADVLGISPQQVRAHARSGHLDGFKMARDWVFFSKHVAVFKARRRRPGRPRSS